MRVLLRGSPTQSNVPAGSWIAGFGGFRVWVSGNVRVHGSKV